ncbi:MAG: hypothetical protein IKS31_08370 [Clostridia bacterium]|nr:hypothetical protein [Clostridia bacterium]
MTQRDLFVRLHVGRIRTLTGEYFLTYDECQLVITYIRENKLTIILGGDVFYKNDMDIYALWCYQSDNTLSYEDNTIQSCDKALSYISSLVNKEMLTYILVLDVKQLQNNN